MKLRALLELDTVGELEKELDRAIELLLDRVIDLHGNFESERFERWFKQNSKHFTIANAPIEADTPITKKSGSKLVTSITFGIPEDNLEIYRTDYDCDDIVEVEMKLTFPLLAVQNFFLDNEGHTSQQFEDFFIKTANEIMIKSIRKFGETKWFYNDSEN